MPVPEPPPPIVVAGETRAGARLAGRIGDGWTASDTNFEKRLPDYIEALPEAGRRRSDQLVLVEVNEGDWLADTSLGRSMWVLDPRPTWERWREAGADGPWFSLVRWPTSTRLFRPWNAVKRCKEWKWRPMR